MNKVSRDYIELKKYINSYIDKYPLPNREQNDINLKKLVTISDKTTTEYIKLRDYIALSNGGFAMKYVQRYLGMLNDASCISDLFQEAMIGVTEAIDEFNTKLNVSFTTYAFFHVRKRLIDFIKRNKLIRAPRDIARNLKHVSEVSSELFSTLQREPSSREIMLSLKKDKGIILTEETIDSIYNLLSLNSCDHNLAFISEFNDQMISEEEEGTLIKRLESNLETSLKSFTEEEQKIISLRFGIGKDYPHHLEEIELMIGQDIPSLQLDS